MKKTYKFTDADLKAAWDIWHKEFNDESVSKTESEFSLMVFEAEKIKHKLGRWPSVAELEAVIAEENEKQNKINDAKEAAFIAKYGKQTKDAKQSK